MADKNGGKINFQVGFSVDKSGLSQMQSLFQQIANKAAEPGSELKTGLQQAAKTASTLNNILTKTFNTDLGSLNVTKFNQELSKSGLSLRSIKADLSQAGNQGVTAFNRLSQAILGTNQQIKQSNKALDQMFTTFKNTVRYGISSSVFNNMANSIQKAFDYSKQLDTSLNDIRIVTDKSAESMGKFAQQANEAAKGMGASTLDYTNAALIYYQQGLSDSEVAARAETTIKAANVTGQKGEEVSEQLTAVWNGYKVTAEETELYVDKLAAVAATTAADLEELSVGMSKVASAANAMGVDFDDLNAQIATIVSVTRQAPESVGTALKTIYARLGDLQVDGVDEFGVSLGKVSEQMVQMGIQILDQNGNLRDMTSVIAEVAEKWSGWTEAQRQAAAVAMAGKRQYNNLIALFDNWDMYTDALNTSTEAMGTLQHQQDIYMESTAAKLKTLKAAWQGLYDDAINEDEINGGIEALTNLVEVFDNFISSFGGGLKSVAGFGAILSSVFNRQISENIVSANQRLEVFKNNLALAQANAQMRALGAGGELDSKASATDIAVEANSKIQLEYAEKIYQARIGLNQEQANTLTGLQQEIGALEQEITLLEQQTKNTELTVVEHQKVADILNYSEEKLFDLNALYGEEETKQERIVNSVKKQSNAIQNVIEEEWTRQGLYDGIEKVNSKITGELHNQIKSLLDELATTNDVKSIREKISNLLDKEVAKEKNNLNTIKKEEEILNNINNLRDQINSKREQQNNKIQQADSMLEAANSATTLTQNIMTVTSALGNMAMAWSSVNSLMNTWNDDSADIGDKILQTVMTLGMTLPMLYTNFKKLNDIFAAHQLLQQKNIILQNLQNEAITLYNLQGDKKSIKDAVEQAAQARHIVLTKTETDSLVEEIAAQVGDTAAKEADTQATNKLTLSQAALNKVMALNPIMIVVAALTALVAAIAFAIKKYDEFIQAQIDSNNKIIEQSNKIQEEVNANQDLYNSYEKLISQYEDNKIEKEALYDTTDKLIDKYNIESGYLAKLTGDYTEFTKAVRTARLEELKQAKEASEKESKAAKQNILPSGQQTKQGRRLGDTYQVLFDYGFVRQDVDKQAENILKRFVDNAYSSQSGSLVSEVDANDPQAIIKQYEQISQAVEKMRDTMSDADRSGSEVFQNAQKYVEEMAPTIEEYKTALSELDEYNVQLLLAENNLEGIKSFEEYNEKINSIREQLTEEFKGDSNKVNSLLNTYLSSIDNEFVKISHGLELLKNEINLSEEDFEKLLNWSDEDKKLLLSGQIEFDGLKTEEELKRALQAAKNNLSEDDLTIVTSLRAKVTSDKKLSKKEIEEAQGESSTLSQDYATEMADFDNQSQLSQLETLNKIVDDKIEINKKYITNAKETAKEDKANLEDRKNNWEEERKALEANKKLHEQGVIGVDFSEEDSDRLKELQNNLIDVEEEIENLDEIAKNGLPFEDLDQLNFDNLISGIDGVISKADLLKDLAEKVGENWTIAASDIENFTRNFPEILAAQENYNILQDGSVQLTKAGQVELQKVLGLKQAELEQSNEAYQQELQKQADLQLATAEYYQNQADQLKEYLSGHQSAAQTEMNLKQNTFDFTQRLSELTGLDNEKLTNVIEENYKKAADSNEQNAQAIYDNYVALGNIAVAASQAFLTGQFNPTPRPSGSGSNGTAASSFTASTRDVSSGDYLKDLTESEIEDMISSAEAAAQKARDRAGEYLAKKLSSQTSTKAASKAMEGAISGAGGKESKSGGGGSKDKQKKEEELKQLEDEFDRYWEIHKALEQIDRDLKKIDKEQEHLNGPELIASLEEENKVLEQQKERYEQLYQAQQAEAAELRGQLSGMGVAFDESSGAILNYAGAVAAALATYNAAVAAFNAGPQDEAAQKSLEAAEKAYENFKKLMERYDTLYYTEMQDTQEKMEDIWRKEMENKLKAWKTKVELELDKNKLEQQWDEFMLKAKKDFKKVWDMRGTQEDSAYQVRTGERAKENVMNTIKRQHEVEADMDRMQAGGESELGFQSIAEARDALKELDETMRENGDTVYEAYQNSWQNYLDGIDQVADGFEHINDEFERQSDILNFNRELIELLYGPEAYDLMKDYYDGQYQANINNLDSLKKQEEYWKGQLVAVGALDEDTGKLTKSYTQLNQDEKEFYDNWLAAESSIRDLSIENIKLAKERRDMQVDAAFAEQEKALKAQREDWEKIKKSSEGYYDSIESTYQIQKLASKYDQSINDAKSIKAQEKLKKLKEEQLDILRKEKQENEKLSEYEVQYANLKYELALKEIALEDAQNTKTDMKLTRDEQGNWSYQYIADDSEVETKRQELLDAYNELYQLSSDAYEKNLESMLELQEEYLERAKEIAKDETLTAEEKQEKLKELADEYYNKEDGYLAILAKENAEIRQNLETETAGWLATMYDQDKDAVKSMTDEEITLVKTLSKENIKDYSDIEKAVKNNYKGIEKQCNEAMTASRKDWTSAAQTIADKWNQDGGKSVRKETKKTFKQIKDADKEFEEAVKETAEVAGFEYGEDGIRGAIEDATQATNDLNSETEQLADDGSRYLEELRGYVNELEGAWREVCSAISDAIDLLREYLSLIGEVESAGSYSAGIADYSAPTPSSSGGSGGGSGGSGSGGGSSGSGHTYTVNAVDDSGTSFKYEGYSNLQTAINVGKNYSDGDDGGYTIKDEKGNVVASGATGMYTGSWNNGSDENNGRLAFLHQKELVLNADDTKNFLAGVNTIRDMVASNGSIEAAVLRAAANMANSLNSMTTPGTIYSGGNTNNSNENVFNITAEFPNANSVDEIREAILSLPNLASQYIHSNLK